MVEIDKILYNLETHGISIVNSLGLESAWDMTDYLEKCKQYEGHVWRQGQVAPYPQTKVTCWPMEDVILSPHFLEFALSFTSIAEEYLGQSPLLYSINAFTTFPVTGELNPDIQEFHRDKDDTKFLALFVYLTNVESTEDGPHEFLTGTREGAEIRDRCFMLGPPGTAFLADTRNLHRGNRPMHCPRTLAWARWGVSDPPASYAYDQLAPIDAKLLGDRYPTDPYLQQSIRLVAR